MKWNSLNLVLILSLFSYSLVGLSKTIVISDIDDTLKKSNSVGETPAQIYHFLKKIPYMEMRDLFQEIKDHEIESGEIPKFYYVSAAQSITFKAQDWLQKYNFPIGRSTLKTLKTKETTYNFKYAVIKNILQNEMATLESGESLKVLMFGDNAQVDAIVYSNLSTELKLNADIYIRDVRAVATFFDSSLEVKKIAGVKYYFSEVELFSNAEFNYLSTNLIARTYASYKDQTLIPNYTLLTLRHRLTNLGHDKISSKTEAEKYWRDYYLRF